jgi:hypothetical protein
MIAKGTRLYNIYDNRTYEILRTEALKSEVIVFYKCLDCNSIDESYIVSTKMNEMLRNIEYGNFVEVK